jgi:hypothetical protein
MRLKFLRGIFSSRERISGEEERRATFLPKPVSNTTIALNVKNCCGFFIPAAKPHRGDMFIGSASDELSSPVGAACLVCCDSEMPPLQGWWFIFSGFYKHVAPDGAWSILASCCYKHAAPTELFRAISCNTSDVKFSNPPLSTL